MLSSKIMFILLALLIASFTFCNVNTKVKENFFNFSRTLRPQLIQVEKKNEKDFFGKGKNRVSFSEKALKQDASTLLGNQNTAKMSNNTMSQLSGGMVTLQPNIENYNKPNINFYQVPSFQANLSPRESSNNTFPGSSITYNLPSQKNTAYNNYVDIVQENYSQENGCSNKNTKPYLSALNPSIPSGYVNGSESYYNAIGTKQTTLSPSSSSNFGTSNTSSTLPISTMENVSDSTSLDLGDDKNEDDKNGDSEIYNAVRYVFANTNSRIRSQGCPFRGDLFIAPCPQVMKTSYGVNDLQQGAMSVMGGLNSGNDSQVSTARYNAARGAQYSAGETIPTSMLSEIGAFTDVNISMN